MSTTTQQMSRAAKAHARISAADQIHSTATDQESVIQLPRDMYLHTPTSEFDKKNGCPTEWWWHTGTLKAADGREFGFEINAAAFYPAFVTEVMLTDKTNQKHYQQTQKTVLPLEGWVESNPEKDWKVDLMNVQMHAPKADPTKNMTVHATINDGPATIEFNLTLNQEGLPFLVWGTGVTSPPSPPTLATNNYYFSLTRLHVTGTIKITIDDVMEEIDVTGITWMDHEWGLFKNHGKAVKWILQDMQLTNGMTISNFSLKTPVLNEIIPGKATVQKGPAVSTICLDSTIQPTKSWKSPEGREYFTEIEVKIPELGAHFTVTPMMDDQLFYPMKTVSPIYEGAGYVTGKLQVGELFENLSGTAWIEQTS